MMPLTVFENKAPVPPPSYQRAQARLNSALHIDALTLVTTLHLLKICGYAVHLSHRLCPPPLPAGPGGAPRRYCEESLLLIALLRILWRLSYQDMHDWLSDWPAFGKLGQSSNKNERDWPLCSKIHPKFLWKNLQTDFHGLTFCRRAGHFSRESCTTGFHLLVNSVRFGSGSLLVCSNIEPDCRLLGSICPNIGTPSLLVMPAVLIRVRE